MSAIPTTTAPLAAPRPRRSPSRARSSPPAAPWCSSGSPCSCPARPPASASGSERLSPTHPYVATPRSRRREGRRSSRSSRPTHGRPRRSAAGPVPPHVLEEPAARPWLTAFLGSLLLALVTIVAVTGFASHAAYNPDLGMNADRPARPGPRLPAVRLADVAVVALRAQPGAARDGRLRRGPAPAGEAVVGHPAAVRVAAGRRRRRRRSSALSIALLVGSALFLFATGVVNAQIYYPFKFNFVQAHYLAAIVFVASLVAARRGQAADDPARLPRARRAAAAARRPRATGPSRTTPTAGSPRSPRPADALAPRPARRSSAARAR